MLLMINRMLLITDNVTYNNYLNKMINESRLILCKSILKYEIVQFAIVLFRSQLRDCIKYVRLSVSIEYVCHHDSC